MKLYSYLDLKTKLNFDQIRRIEIYNKDKTLNEHYTKMLPFAILDFNGVLGFKKAIQNKSRYAWDRMDNYLYKIIPFKHKKKSCPHCGKQLVETSVKGYYGQCLECDEDFYSFEAV